MRGRICCCSGRGHCESHEQGVSRGEQPWRVGCSRRANLGPLQGAHGRREGEEQLANGCRFAFHHHTLLSTSHVTLAPWVSIECMREGGTTTQYPHSSGADWPGKNERRRSRSALPGRQKLCILFFFSPLLRRWYLSDPAQQPFRPPVRTVDLDSWNFPPAGTSKKSARREGKKKGTFPACGADAGPAGLGSSTCAPAFPFSMSSSQITTLPRASRPGLVASEASVVGPGWLLLVSTSDLSDPSGSSQVPRTCWCHAISSVRSA